MSDQSPPRNWQSVRTVLEGLILAGIVWMASSMQQQIVSIAKLQEQMSQMSATLANIPDLTTRVTKVEMQLNELQRRQELDDKFREQHAQQVGMKGWVR